MKLFVAAVLGIASLFLLHGVTTPLSAAPSSIELGSGTVAMKGVQVPFGVLMAATLVGGLLLLRRNG